MMCNAKRSLALLTTVSVLVLGGCQTTPVTSGTETTTTVATSEGNTTTIGTTTTTAAQIGTPTQPVAVGDKVEFGGKQWEVTFSDDFDGTKLNSQNWTYSAPVQRGDFGNNYWNRKQVKLNGDGYLSLGIDYDAEKDKIYSGALTTDRIFEQAYGYFECRAKLQAATGCWSAFWIMSNDIVKVGNGGTDGAEIDIFESPFFTSGAVQSAVHWDGYEGHHESMGSPMYRLPDMYSEFHTFALEWTKDQYIFYVDNVPTWRTQGGGVCEVPCYLQLSVEAGSWGGEFVKEQMPAEFLVDYVRVYKEVE